MKVILSSERELLPAPNVIDLLVQQTSPCFTEQDRQQAASGIDLDNPSMSNIKSVLESHGRPPFDRRQVIQERKWTDRINHGVASRSLILRDADGLPTSALRVEMGFFAPANLAQWIADYVKPVGGVELDGALVTPRPVLSVQPAAPEPQYLKKGELIETHQHRWPTIEQDLAEATRKGPRSNGLAEAARTRHGVYDEKKALAWAREHGKLTGNIATYPVNLR